MSASILCTSIWQESLFNFACQVSLSIPFLSNLYPTLVFPPQHFFFICEPSANVDPIFILPKRLYLNFAPKPTYPPPKHMGVPPFKTHQHQAPCSPVAWVLYRFATIRVPVLFRAWPPSKLSASQRPAARDNALPWLATNKHVAKNNPVSLVSLGCCAVP